MSFSSPKTDEWLRGAAERIHEGRASQEDRDEVATARRNAGSLSRELEQIIDNGR